MNRIILSSVFTLFLIFSSIQNIAGQKKWSIDSNVSSYAGFENNPYKSPDSLFSVSHNTGYSKQELIKTDYFIEYNYDIDVSGRIGKKLLLDLTSQWQNKKYLEEKILNTDRFNIGIAPAYRINRKVTIGGGYEFEKRAMIDADILGEQTKYVLSYHQNQAQFFVKTKPFKNNILNFYYFFQDRKYSNTYSSYTPATQLPVELNLDYIQHTLDIRTVQRLNKRTRFNVGLRFYDRTYEFLPSYETLLTPIENMPRHYQDFRVNFGLNSKVNNVVHIRPYASYERRTDKYNDYFSYNRIDVGFETRLTHHKWVLNVDLLSKLYNYDKFEAPIIGSQSFPPLEYRYYISDIMLTYRLLRGVNLDAGVYFERRNSNANRPTWRYRRGYDNFIVKGGIVIYPEDLF